MELVGREVITEKTQAFLEIFCDCYAEYVNAIENLKLKNKNLFKSEVSPYQFLSYHNTFKLRILRNDITVLGELSYLNRRRCLSLEPSVALTLLMFLSNLCVYAKLATKSFDKLSTEEQVMGENILNRYAQRKMDVAAAQSTEDEVWQELFTELPQDFGNLMDTGTGDYLRQKFEEIAAQNSGPVNPMEIVRILMSDDDNSDEKAPKLDIMNIVGKISDRITEKMKAGKLDEGALIRQSMRLMGHLPSRV